MRNEGAPLSPLAPKAPPPSEDGGRGENALEGVIFSLKCILVVKTLHTNTFIIPVQTQHKAQLSLLRDVWFDKLRIVVIICLMKPSCFCTKE